MYVTLDAQSDLPYYSWLILQLNWILTGGEGKLGGGGVLVSPLETGIPKWDEIISERFCINCHW